VITDAVTTAGSLYDFFTPILVRGCLVDAFVEVGLYVL